MSYVVGEPEIFFFFQYRSVKTQFVDESLYFQRTTKKKTEARAVNNNVCNHHELRENNTKLSFQCYSHRSHTTTICVYVLNKIRFREKRT